MYDPRKTAILVKFRTSPSFEDKTAQCQGYRFDGQKARITLPKGTGTAEYSVPLEGFHVLEHPVLVATAATHLIAVRGRTDDTAAEVWQFSGGGMTWYRVFTSSGAPSARGYRTVPAEEIELLPRAHLSRGHDVLAYFRRVVEGLPADDPLRDRFEQLTFIHQDSALARYLEGAPLDPVGEEDEGVRPALFPFSFNASQREAVETSLRHPISVIDGPPGTGKTQTILNLIANIIQSPGVPVGVVSFNNAAVDNVREKLEKNGIGFVAAWLGNRGRRDAFFAGQGARDELLATFRAQPHPKPVREEDLAEHAKLLRSLQALDRELAQDRELLAAYGVEQRHFEAHCGSVGLSEPGDVPLFRRSSDRILQYLAESEVAEDDGRRWSRLVARIRGYFVYGSSRLLDPDDTEAILQVQRMFYRRRIEELEQKIRDAEERLRQADFAGLAERHRGLSMDALHAGLRERYAGPSAQAYTWKDYKRRFFGFTVDYPVILSTCHSLRRNLPEGWLLDYLIIDESSQVDLLVSTLAMSVCRHLIVVGDERQLPQITKADAAAHAGEPPLPAFSYEGHSILTSLVDLYGDALPRTMLREHYRCHPDIIGFCNKRFYGGQLIPYTHEGAGADPLRIVRTPPGNHMRHFREGGNVNQREAEIVAETVIPTYFRGVPPERIGITTPYRRQVETVSSALSDDALDLGMQVDTVHKFQGREKDIVIMSAVLDGTRQGSIASPFADNEQLINVAVSRAVQQFVLVTHHKDLPRSRNLRDLIGYIAYRFPENDVIDDSIISVFDLLYSEYSERLRGFAGRLRGDMKYRSEDIIWTLLHEIIAQPAYAHLGVVAHVRLVNLFGNLDGLPAEQVAFIKTSAHVDFLVFNRVTNRAVLAVEVDGFAYHANDPVQKARDEKKDSICVARGLSMLRLCTTESRERERIVTALDDALTSPSNLDISAIR